jgi:RND family efflux transporter MFP subunit
MKRIETAFLLGLLLGAGASAAFLLVWKRDHPHPPRKEGPAEHEHTAQVTAFGDRFEVFLEHGEIVAGEKVKLNAHVTDLKTAHARREGRVTFVLRLGEEPPLEVAVESPKRPGIYVGEVTFPAPGDWEAKVRIPVEGAESVVELPPFHVHAPGRRAHEHGIEPPEGIAFLKEQQWKVLTRAEPAGRRRLVERVRLPGEVAARPGSKAAVVPPLSGRLLAPPGRALPSLGDRVGAGQTLALVQPPFSDFAAKLVEANAEAVRTKLALDHAEQAAARVQKLAAGQAKTERELQESEFALRAARANHEAALGLKAAYEKAGAVFGGGDLPAFELKAPIAGVVTRVEAAPGEHVAADRAVFTLLDPGRVFLEARIAEADLRRIGAALGAVYEMPGEGGRFLPILGEGGGRLVQLGLEVDPHTRAVALLYEVPNPDGRLRIGMALTIYVETARVEEGLAIPLSAVVEEEGRNVAFVQVAGETFQKRDLGLGLRDSGFVQVLDGILPGERVVTQGAYAIRLASVSSSVPAHGHEH